jgi:hypothetical protein
MNLLYLNTFFRQGSGAAIAVVPNLRGVMGLFLQGYRDFIPIDQAFYVVLEGLQDGDGDYVNNATLTATVHDANGVELVTPQSMTYETGSHGTYKAALPATLTLTDGSPYDVIVSSGDGVVYRRMTRFARYFGRA